mgnify:CR=1 FL=1
MSNLIDNHVPDFLLSPRFKFVRHFLLLLTLVCITISIFANQSGELVLTWERFYGWVFYFLLTSVIIYFNLYVLAPRFLIKGRLLKYLASMLVLTSFSLVFIAILQMNVQEVSANYEDGNPYIILNMITSIISFGLLIFGTSALLLFKYWIGYSQRIDELASSTLQSELKFLKKQINPHFLFNMLNNANVLIKKNPEEVFSFAKIRGMDSYLSPEMKSTGEAIGYDDKLTRALYKALQATGMHVSNYGTIFVTIADHDKEQALPLVKRFYDLGFNIEATTGTAEFLRAHGIRTRTRRKLNEGSNEIIEALRQGHVSYVINTIDINQHNTRLDGYEIRRTAVENNVTVFTALETVKVLLDVLEEITLRVSTIDSK